MKSIIDNPKVKDRLAKVFTAQRYGGICEKCNNKRSNVVAAVWDSITDKHYVLCLPCAEDFCKGLALKEVEL